MYAQVVVDTGATSSIDSLTYEIPDSLVGRVGVGTCVLVPLSSRQAVGYVIGLEETSPVEKTRPILAKLDSPVSLTDDTFRLAEWISSRYLSPLPRVVAGMLPGVMHCKVQGRIEVVECGEQRAESSEQPDCSGGPPSPPVALTPSETELLRRIADQDGGATIESLGDDRATVQRLVRQLEKKNVARRVWQLIPPSGKPRIMRGVRLVADANGTVGAKHLHASPAMTDRFGCR